ncbi:MAG: glycoside hydrolase family 10 protein [Armatimonadota bacterium]
MRFILLALLLLSGATCRAEPAEFRGLWVHNWRHGLLSPAEVAETVRWAEKCNINALVVQVRRIGDAYYNSSLEPRAANIEAGPEYDPLACVIESAKGMQVHAWVNLCRVAGEKAPTDPGHIANLHPEWLSKNASGVANTGEGLFLDPGVPEVREYLAKIVGEIAEKYPIDGVMLDYVRYPGRDWGYNEIAVAAFNKEYGLTGKPAPDDARWCEWRREQVTEMVRAIRWELDRVKPGIPLSAATVAWGSCPEDFTRTSAYRALFQDWRTWMREGLIDANMPMNYKDPADQKSSAWFSDWVRGAKRWSYGRPVYCGLMVYTPSGAVSQIKQARSAGADGVVGFAFSQSDCKDELAALLAKTVFSGPCLKDAH